MKNLKLEVGKTYQSRNGEEVKITGFAEGIQYPYKGDKGKWYSESGQWANKESPYDLIAEAPIADTEKRTFKLEVGKTYLTRHGEEVKIVGDNGHEMFPFEGDNCLSYTLDGHWDFERDSAFDLIAEADAAQPEKLTFKIPENTREISVSETDGRIIIEFVPEAPELTERERIRAFLHQRGWEGVSEDSISDIEAYIKHREAQQCK